MRPEFVAKKCGCGIDISRTAKSLIEQHGRDAILVAARWADCAAHAGNHERAVAWRQIVDVVTRRCGIKRTRKPACQTVSSQSRAA